MVHFDDNAASTLSRVEVEANAAVHYWGSCSCVDGREDGSGNEQRFYEAVNPFDFMNDAGAMLKMPGF